MTIITAAAAAAANTVDTTTFHVCVMSLHLQSQSSARCRLLDLDYLDIQLLLVVHTDRCGLEVFAESSSTI